MLSQCIVEQTEGVSHNGLYGIDINFSTGQSMTTCEEGKVSYFAFNVISIVGNPIARIELYKGDSYTNLVRTVDNYIPIVGWNVINIDEGSGINYSLNTGEKFRIRWWITSPGDNGYFFYLSTENPYAGGQYLNSSGGNINVFDRVFMFSMNGAPLLAKVKIEDVVFQNLSQAIYAAQPNDTIYVIEDFTETLSIPLPQDVILNIPSSKTVTLNGSFTNNGTIINNGTLIKNTLTNNVNGIYLGNGTFTGNFINNGTFKPGG
jgi:hypothetical protein